MGPVDIWRDNHYPMVAEEHAVCVGNGIDIPFSRRDIIHGPDVLIKKSNPRIANQGRHLIISRRDPTGRRPHRPKTRMVMYTYTQLWVPAVKR